MLAAHQDEVGFIVTYITDEGNLKFTTVGGINPEVVIGRQLHFKNGTVGVVGGKAVHQRSPKERDEPVKLDTLTIDIGASSKAEAENTFLPVTAHISEAIIPNLATAICVRKRLTTELAVPLW